MDDRLGHKTPDCQGQWIDVSTLTAPHRQLCSACRATRINRDDTDEVHDSGPVTDLRAPTRWSYTPTPFFILFLFALFMAFILGHFIGSRP